MNHGDYEYESAMHHIRDGAAALAWLVKERDKEYRKRNFEGKWDAIWHAEYLVKHDLEERRRNLAVKCEPWFDASAFVDCCPKCGGETYTAKYGPECSAGCDTSILTCSECGWQGDPE